MERRKDGSFYTVDQAITPLRDDSGLITHFIAIHSDITSRVEESQYEHFLAYHDALTHLPNRTLFLKILQQAIGDAKKTRQLLAISFVDLDNFKPANDTFGHYFGDRLLITVANRLSTLVRKTDTVARLGGDEFIILQPNLPNTTIAANLAYKVLQTIAQPFVFEGKSAQVTASIGIAIYPTDGEGPDTLLQHADEAMYRAKSLGRNRHEFFTREDKPSC